MADLTSILAHIRDNIVEVPTATENRLVGWVNEAQRVAEAAHQWMPLNQTWVTTTTAGVRWIGSGVGAKPTDWIAARGNPWWRTGDTGAMMPLEWIPSEHDSAKDHPYSSDESYRGAPVSLEERATKVFVYPLPDLSNPIGEFSIYGGYEIVIPYRAQEETLADSGTTSNWFTSDFDQALHLEDYASGQAMLFNRDFDNANVYLLKAQGHLLRAKRMDKFQKFQHFKLTPRRDVYASRRQARAV
jgi:hypothetical protein